MESAEGTWKLNLGTEERRGNVWEKNVVVELVADELIVFASTIVHCDVRALVGGCYLLLQEVWLAIVFSQHPSSNSTTPAGGAYPVDNWPSYLSCYTFIFCSMCCYRLLLNDTFFLRRDL